MMPELLPETLCAASESEPARSNRHSGFTRLRMCDSWDSRFFDLGSSDGQAI